LPGRIPLGGFRPDDLVGVLDCLLSFSLSFLSLPLSLSYTHTLSRARALSLSLSVSLSLSLSLPRHLEAALPGRISLGGFRPDDLVQLRVEDYVACLF
jgi:hypothetical protein